MVNSRSSKVQNNLLGELQIAPKQARDLKNKSKLGKQSPFVEIVLNRNSSRQKTKNDKRGHTKPSWEDVLCFDLYKDEDIKFNVRVLCSNLNTSTKYLGGFVMDLSHIIEKRELDGWFKLYSDYNNSGIECGELYLEMTFYPINEKRAVSQSTLSKRMNINKLIQKEIEENETGFAKSIEDLNVDKFVNPLELFNKNNSNSTNSSRKSIDCFVQEINNIFNKDENTKIHTKLKTQNNNISESRSHDNKSNNNRPLPKIPAKEHENNTTELPRRRTLPCPPKNAQINNRLPNQLKNLDFKVNKCMEYSKHEVKAGDEINAIFDEVMSMKDNNNDSEEIY